MSYWNAAFQYFAPFTDFIAEYETRSWVQNTNILKLMFDIVQHTYIEPEFIRAFLENGLGTLFITFLYF